MLWRRYSYRNFMTHVVPVELEGPLFADLVARGAELSDLSSHNVANPAEITDWHLDTGGPTHLHRPLEEFTWAGLAMSMPCDQVPRILRALERLKLRRFVDGTLYRKLKLWMHATVMTPGQSEELLAIVAARAAGAAERTRMFEIALERGAVHGVS